MKELLELGARTDAQDKVGIDSSHQLYEGLIKFCIVSGYM